jgi:L-threonylcarbamoyladenylate synthase
MPTTVLPIDPANPQQDILTRAAETLRLGRLVAFPTETVYGLGANALDPDAVARIFAAKGRPATNPLIVHAASIDQAKHLAEWSENAQRLAVRFWPGPLTLVLPKRSVVPNIITAGGFTVAVRMPAHPVALGLIGAAGVPRAAPSANRSTHLSPTRAEHVLAGLEGRIDMILAGGPTAGGLESTVLDLTTEPPQILRPGLVAPSDLEVVVGPILRPVAAALPEGLPLRSPGLLTRHYAPRAVLTVHQGDSRQVVQDLVGQGMRVGWLTFDAVKLPGALVVAMPRHADEYAAQLFAALHELDRTRVDRIVVDEPPDDEAWLAVRDRLRRASQ